MKKLSTYVTEQLLQESKFVYTDFKSHKDTGAEYDSVLGYIDADRYLTWNLYVEGPHKGESFAAVFSGSKYLPTSTKAPFSKKYAIDAVPAKWANAIDELRKMYETTYMINNIVESASDIKVNFYADSYQYAEPQVFHDITTAKAVASEKILNDSKASNRHESYWASFSIGRDEMFSERIKVVHGKIVTNYLK